MPRVAEKVGETLVVIILGEAEIKRRPTVDVHLNFQLRRLGVPIDRPAFGADGAVCRAILGEIHIHVGHLIGGKR